MFPLMVVALAVGAQSHSISLLAGEDTGAHIEAGGRPIAPAGEVLPSSLTRAIDRFAGLKAAAVLEVFIVIDNPFLDGDPVETDGVKIPLGALIRDENTPMLFDLISSIERSGGEVLDVFYLTGIVHARLSQRSFFDVIGSPAVIDASIEMYSLESSAVYNGVDFRAALRADVFTSQGFTGNVGNRINPSLPTIVATIDSSEMPLDSRGYLDSASSGSRLFHLWDCASQSPCLPETFGPPSLGIHHSDAVLTVVGGSIEQGQNSQFPGTATTAQRQRSGISRETDMIYIKASNTTDLVRALELAWDEDSDVANLPFFTQGNACDPTTNPSSLNSTINLVTGLGLTVVASSGNKGNTQGVCSISYPSLRPNVVAVGHLESQFTTAPYGSLPLSVDSSLGGLPIVVSGFGSRTTSGIALVGPGQRTLVQSGLTSYSTGTFVGSSMSTAAISGLLADIINGYGSSYTGIHNSYRQRSLLYLMGDRFGGIGTSTVLADRTSNLSGYGRIVGRLPTDATFGSTFSLQEGDVLLTATTPSQIVAINTSPTSATRFKAVAHWNESDLANTAHITFTLRDTCNGSVAVIDDSFSLTKRLATNFASGDCLRLEISAQSLPSSRRVYFAFLLHSGTFN